MYHLGVSKIGGLFVVLQVSRSDAWTSEAARSSYDKDAQFIETAIFWRPATGRGAGA